MKSIVWVAVRKQTALFRAFCWLTALQTGYCTNYIAKVQKIRETMTYLRRNPTRRHWYGDQHITQEGMFVRIGSSGSISSSLRSCHNQKQISKLQIDGVNFLQSSPAGDCSHDVYGPIGEWDVSRVTDMSVMFLSESLFKGDISQWDVSKVEDIRMSVMFWIKIVVKSFQYWTLLSYSMY